MIHFFYHSHAIYTTYSISKPNITTRLDIYWATPQALCCSLQDDARFAPLRGASWLLDFILIYRSCFVLPLYSSALEFSLFYTKWYGFNLREDYFWHDWRCGPLISSIRKTLAGEIEPEPYYENADGHICSLFVSLFARINYESRRKAT